MAKNIIVLFICFPLFLVGNPNISGDCDHGRVDKRECVLESARSYIGVRELTGKNDGIEVEYFLSTVNLGKGFAWCGAFAYAQLIECIEVIGKPSSFAWVPSWDQLARRVYDNKIGNWDKVRPADLFLLYYANLGRVGHIGFIEEVKEGSIITIEGNTNDAMSREGDGVYRKIRPKRTIYRAVNWIDQ